MADKLLPLVLVLQRNKSATIDALTLAFSEDYGHFARANNRDPLTRAASALGKKAHDVAIAAALTAAYQAGGLTVGFIGARLGKFEKAKPEVTQPFNEAIEAATAAFKESLKTAECFIEATPLTDDEKAARKTEKAEKAEKARQDVLSEAVRAGEIVRACDIHPMPDDVAQVEHVCMLLASGMLPEALRAKLVEALAPVAPVAALAAPVAPVAPVTA